jgi:hypothetical protein
MGRTSSASKSVITLDAMRREFYSAVACDAPDALGYPRAAPRTVEMRCLGLRTKMELP